MFHLWNLVLFTIRSSTEEGPTVRSILFCVTQLAWVVCHPRNRIYTFNKCTVQTTAPKSLRNRQCFLKGSHQCPNWTQFQPLRFRTVYNVSMEIESKKLCREKHLQRNTPSSAWILRVLQMAQADDLHIFLPGQQRILQFQEHASPLYNRLEIPSSLRKFFPITLTGSFEQASRKEQNLVRKYFTIMSNNNCVIFPMRLPVLIQVP